ncbi:MAG: threonine/serine dehydratase [Pseudomonadota bacterium]
MHWQSDIKAARDRIAGYVRRTPVMEMQIEGLTHPVALKLELAQHTGSFKPRGAFNTLLSSDVPEGGIVAASGGNHGAAVAYAANHLGHKARIYVPEIAGPSKIAMIERTGADLVVVEGKYFDALKAARAYEAETGAIQIHAYDLNTTVAGQGTVMLEWEEQGLEADTVLIAVGGGGLIGGAIAWVNGRRQVVAIEPEECPSLHDALKAGKPVETKAGGIAANALGPRQIGDICFGLAQAQSIQSILVSDDEIIEAQYLLWREARILTEPAGAAALAALTSGAYKPAPDERVAVLICGGNIAPDPLA